MEKNRVGGHRSTNKQRFFLKIVFTGLSVNFWTTIIYTFMYKTRDNASVIGTDSRYTMLALPPERRNFLLLLLLLISLYGRVSIICRLKRESNVQSRVSFFFFFSELLWLDFSKWRYSTSFPFVIQFIFFVPLNKLKATNRSRSNLGKGNFEESSVLTPRFSSSHLSFKVRHTSNRELVGKNIWLLEDWLFSSIMRFFISSFSDFSNNSFFSRLCFS